MKKVLCPECGKLTIPEIIKAEREVEIRGEKIKVVSEMPKCGNCGKEFLMKDAGVDSYTLAYNLYRKNHNMLLPAEITAIREKYGMSPKPFSLLLGWGELTIYKYEKGGLQDDAHDEVLKLINDPENMKALYESKLRENLKPDDRPPGFDVLLNQLCAGINPYDRILRLKFGYKPDEYSGNKTFEIKKTINMVLKIIECSVKSRLFEVQLLKCMFYSDFLFFKNNNISITGMQYANGPYGPIPNDYHDVLSYMMNAKMINMQVVAYENGEGHLYTVAQPPDDSVFSGIEKEHISMICEKLTPLGSKQLSDKTHKEVEGWKKTMAGQLITYRYAEKLGSL